MADNRDRTRPQTRDCKDCAHHTWWSRRPWDGPDLPDMMLQCWKRALPINCNSEFAADCEHFELSKRCCECVHSDLAPHKVAIVMCKEGSRVAKPIEGKMFRCAPVATEVLPYSCEYNSRKPCNNGCNEFIPRDKPAGETVQCLQTGGFSMGV